jgi:membrane associated rhomboid family serine protease
MNSSYSQPRQFTFRRDPITHAAQRLLLANVIVFAIQLLLHIPFGGGSPYLGGEIAGFGAFKVGSVMSGQIWRPFTYMFLHAGLYHLFINMLCLFFFGPDVERALGTRQFYRFFFACGVIGVCAGFIPYFWFSGEAVYDPAVVGASGAAMGCLVAYATLNPDREITLFPLPIPINVKAVVFLLIIINLVGALRNDGSSVATHFGGMAVGYAYIKLRPLFGRGIRFTTKKKRKPGGPMDALGEAVDNVFKFEEEKRRRK